MSGQTALQSKQELQSVSSSHLNCTGGPGVHCLQPYAAFCRSHFIIRESLLCMDSIPPQDQYKHFLPGMQQHMPSQEHPPEEVANLTAQLAVSGALW